MLRHVEIIGTLLQERKLQQMATGAPCSSCQVGSGCVKSWTRWHITRSSSHWAQLQRAQQQVCTSPPTAQCSLSSNGWVSLSIMHSTFRRSYYIPGDAILYGTMTNHQVTLSSSKLVGDMILTRCGMTDVTSGSLATELFPETSSLTQTTQDLWDKWNLEKYSLSLYI